MYNLQLYQLALTSLIVFAQFAKAAGPTSIFINQIPEYSSLSTCAEAMLRTIVRNMAYDCGDGSRTTSFDCFCSTSSSQVASRIDSRVADSCSQESEAGQNASALDVFAKYCQLSTKTTQSSQPTVSPSASTTIVTSTISSASTTPSPSSSSAAPGSSPSSASPTASASSSSSSPTASSNSTPASDEKKTPVVAIAVGVVAPVAAIALGILAFVLYRSRQPKDSPPPPKEVEYPELPGDAQIYEARNSSAPQQLHAYYKPDVAPIEIGGSQVRAELASPTAKSGVSLEAYRESMPPRSATIREEEGTPF